MGKENLLYRPGRASGESIVETPDAQLLKTLSFAFGWRTYRGTFDEAQHARVSKTWLTEFPVYQDSDFLNGRLRFCWNDEKRDYPETYSALNLPATFRDALVSAVKCAEDHSGIIVRFYNPHLETDVAIPSLPNTHFVMLDEVTPMPTRLTLRPNDVQTVQIKRI